MLISVNYHYIKEYFNAPYPSIFGVTPDQFAEHLDHLGKDAVFVGNSDIIDIIDGNQRMPSRAVAITFDDGLKEQYDLARPILLAKGIPAIFFINTRPIEEDFVTYTHKIHIIRAYTCPADLENVLRTICNNENVPFNLPDAECACKVYKYDTPDSARIKYYLNHILGGELQTRIIDQCFAELEFDQKQISSDLYISKEMAQKLSQEGMLGTHSHDHLPLGLLEEDKAKADLDMSLSKIRQWTGQDVSALSYPFGFKNACSPAIADHARLRNIKFAFTMERAGNHVMDRPMFLGRFSCTDIFENGTHNLDNFWQEVNHATWFRQSCIE